MLKDERIMRDMHPFGQLWGWSDKEAEAAMLGRMEKLMHEDEEGGNHIIHSDPNIVRYPEHGLICIQTETWVSTR